MITIEERAQEIWDDMGKEGYPEIYQQAYEDAQDEFHDKHGDERAELKATQEEDAARAAQQVAPTTPIVMKTVRTPLNTNLKLTRTITGKPVFRTIAMIGVTTLTAN
jgi:hypothetical protein